MSRKRITLVASLFVFAPLAGCEQPSEPPRYRFVSGEIAEIRPETGELFLRPRDRTEARPPAVACVVTGDAEIDIQGRLVHLRELRAGDAVEVLGYFEQARGERFVVCVARVERAGLPGTAVGDVPPAAPNSSDAP